MLQNVGQRHLLFDGIIYGLDPFFEMNETDGGHAHAALGKQSMEGPADFYPVVTVFSWTSNPSVRRRN